MRFRVLAAMLFCLALAMAGPGRSDERNLIAFVANVDDNWDVFVARADGTGLHRLTRTAWDERSPVLSPDRAAVAYATSDGDLWIRRLDEEQPVRLSLPEGRHAQPSWAPDGQEIVFPSYVFPDAGEDSEIWEYSFETKETKPLLVQSGIQEQPSLSPDGRFLLYLSSGTAALHGLGTTIIQQLWTASLVDGSFKQMSLPTGRHRDPRWSPDGARVVFSSDTAGDPDLWVIDASGANLKRLTDGPEAEMQPVWSPDGTEIAHIAAVDGRMELRILDLEGGRSRVLNPFGDQAVDIMQPDWR